MDAIRSKRSKSHSMQRSQVNFNPLNGRNRRHDTVTHRGSISSSNHRGSISGHTLTRESQDVESHQRLRDVSLAEVRGIPVRDTLQYVYRLERDKNIASAIIFLVYVACFFFITYNWYDVHDAYTSNAAVVDLFLDEEFPGAQYKKNWHDIMTQQEFWQWVEGPLINGLYPGEWGNGYPKAAADRGYVLDVMRLVGDVQFRQIRVSNHGCGRQRYLSEKSAQACELVKKIGASQEKQPLEFNTSDPLSRLVTLPCITNVSAMVKDIQTRPVNISIGGNLIKGKVVDSSEQCACGAFDTVDGSCYARLGLLFATGQDDRSTDGGVWKGAQPAANAPISTYNPGNLSDLYGLVGFQPWGGYKKSGFTVSIDGGNASLAQEQVRLLKESFWVDRGTRVLAVDFNLYNTQSAMVTVMRVVFEFLASGYIAKTYRIFSMRLVYYDDLADMSRLGVEIIYGILLGHYIVREIKRFRSAWKSIDPWAYFTLGAGFEWLIIAVNLLMFALWGIFITDSRKDNFDVNGVRYIDIHGMAQLFSNCFGCVGILALLYSLKLFKFLSISPKFNALWMTLSFALSDLLFFSLGGLVLVIGFAFCGMFLFGHMDEGFHDVGTSVSTLLRYPLGEFDYDRMTLAGPWLGPIFFAVYVAMVFVVVMNLFIGIINKYFDEVHTLLQTTDWWKVSAQTWMYSLVRRFYGAIVALRHKSLGATQFLEAFQADVQLRRDEKIFLQRLRDASKAAKSDRSISLFAYLKHIYENEAESDFMYISEGELCALTAVSPCGAHHRAECYAKRLVEAYYAMTVSTMPSCIQHEMGQSLVQRPNSSLAGASRPFFVWKINRGGRLQPRHLVITSDDAEPRLISFASNEVGSATGSDAARYARKKVLPLSQLTKIDAPPRRTAMMRCPGAAQLLRLTFTSQGYTPNADIPNTRTLDTQYKLVFNNAASANAFRRALQEAVPERPAGQGNVGEQDDAIQDIHIKIEDLEIKIDNMMQSIQDIAEHLLSGDSTQRRGDGGTTAGASMSKLPQSNGPDDDDNDGDDDDLF